MKKKFNKLAYQIINSGNVSILSRIKDSLKVIKDDFLLCYGDTITDININKLIAHHKQRSNSVTISSYPITIPFGVMGIDKDQVKSFDEKPILSDVMNIGYYYFTKKFHNSNLGKIFFTSTFHNIHHSKNNCNYGLYFILLDQFFGTMYSEYETIYNKIKLNKGHE